MNTIYTCAPKVSVFMGSTQITENFLFDFFKSLRKRKQVHGNKAMNEDRNELNIYIIHTHGKIC